MATFTAVESGPLDDGATFGNPSPGASGVDWPAAGDTVDLNGYTLTQGTVAELASLVNTNPAGGQLDLAGDFACPSIVNAFCYLKAAADLIDVGITSNLNTSAFCVEFNASLGEFRGTVALTGIGGGLEINTPATVDLVSAVFTNGGAGANAITNAGGTATEISGNISVSGEGGVGVYNAGGTVGTISGKITVSGVDAYSVYQEAAGTIALWKLKSDAKLWGNETGAEITELQLAGPDARFDPAAVPANVLPLVITLGTFGNFGRLSELATALTEALDGGVGIDPADPVALAVTTNLDAKVSTSGSKDASQFTGVFPASVLANVPSAGGTGAISTTIVCENTSGTPLDGVAVWITSDSAGTHLVAGKLFSNAAGQAVFMLEAGTYYVWRQRSGMNFDNPQVISPS